MLCDYTAGFLSGFFATLIGHPLDTIKTQQQLRAIGLLEASRRIHQHRGLLGFYRGLSVPLIGQGLLNSVFFGIYGDLKDYLIGQRSSLSELDPKFNTLTEVFIAGTIAGTATLPIISPIELIKTKLQSQMKRTEFAGPKDCFKIIIRDAGVKGLYRGIMPLFWRDAFGGGAYFVGYEIIKENMEKIFPKNAILEGVVGGGIAGVVNWAIFLPFDTIKTRMQSDDHRKPHYRNQMHVAREILSQNGSVGFYRGILSVWTRAFPVNASIFFIIEVMDKYFCRTDKPKPT